MKIFSALILALMLVLSGVAFSIPLDSFSVFSTAHPNTRPGQYVQLLARGTGTDNYYVMEVNPTTGGFPVDIVAGSLTLSYDQNYGVVGASTLRTAAQIGNATGAAAFGTGNTSAQTLRVDIANDDIVPVSQSGTWNINNISGTVSLPTGASTEATLSTLNGKVNSNYGAASGAVRTASQIGNATAVADFGAGAVSAQTLRTIIASDQSAIPASQSGTWNITNISGTVSLPTGASTEATLSTLNGKVTNDFGVASAGVRTNALLGVGTTAVSNANPVPISDAGASITVDGSVSATNFPATADVNYGTPGASTIRGAAMLGVGSTAVSNSNPVPINDAGGSITVDGTVSASNFPSTVDTNTGAAGASTIRTVLSTRQEAAATPLSVRISDGSAFSIPATAGRSYSDSARIDYSSTNVTTAAYVQVIASTAAAINAITVFNGCGESLYLATGAAASEVVKSIIPPGGMDGTISLLIAASTRIAIKGLSGNCTSGQFIINGYN